MLLRFDLTDDEATHFKLLSDLCKNASRSDFVDIIQSWDTARLCLLSRRLVVLRPAEQLEDFECLYYGDELQERFGADFTGYRFAEVPELEEIRDSLDAFRQVALHKTPHFSRVSRTQRDPEGIDYTRILYPVLKGGSTRLVVGIMVFLD
jgi:hypothetical protein